MALLTRATWLSYRAATLVAEDGLEMSNNTSKHISLPRQFSEGEPTEWFQRYEICSDANDWDDETKAKKLPTLLEGEALAIWLELTTEEKGNYGTSKAKIITRMAPVRFVSLDEFRARRLNPGESLPVFLHELKQLSKKAMPDADAATRTQLLLHQFVSGLPVHIGKQLRATGDVSDLDRVLERAKLLMTIEEPQKTAAVQTSEVQELQEQVSTLTEQVAALSARRWKRPAAVVCYKCQQPGHLQRNCPLARKCYLCGQPGHIARDCHQGNYQGMSQRGRGHPKN